MPGVRVTAPSGQVTVRVSGPDAAAAGRPKWRRVGALDR